MKKRDNKFEEKKADKQGENIDYKVKYDKPIDSITIYYAEWSYLQFMRNLLSFSLT